MENKFAKFELHQNGLFHRDFEGIKIRVCDAVEVLAVVSNLKATQWGKLIEFTNAHNQKKNLVAPMKLLMNTPRYLAAELSLRGLRINSSMQCMRLLREYLTGEHPKKILVLDYNSLWNRAIFVKPKSETLEIEIPSSNAVTAVCENHPVILRLKSFIEKHRKLFQDLNSSRSLLQKIGYKRKIGGKVLYYIPPKYFKREITDSEAEMEILAKVKLLIPDNNGHFCSVAELLNRKERAYVVKNR